MGDIYTLGMRRPLGRRFRITFLCGIVPRGLVSYSPCFSCFSCLLAFLARTLLCSWLSHQGRIENFNSCPGIQAKTGFLFTPIATETPMTLTCASSVSAYVARCQRASSGHPYHLQTLQLGDLTLSHSIGTHLSQSHLLSKKTTNEILHRSCTTHISTRKTKTQAQAKRLVV